MKTQESGQIGEDLAARHLQAQGYKIVTRNWRPSGGMRGEIDIIAWIGKTLCFVEVKARRSNDHGAPQESVTISKQRQISRLANAYVSLHNLADVPCRFDVVEVWLPSDGTPSRLALHQNAFDYIESSAKQRRGARIF